MYISQRGQALSFVVALCLRPRRPQMLQAYIRQMRSSVFYAFRWRVEEPPFQLQQPHILFILVLVQTYVHSHHQPLDITKLQSSPQRLYIPLCYGNSTRL
jgi:hypothetical protein